MNTKAAKTTRLANSFNPLRIPQHISDVSRTKLLTPLTIQYGNIISENLLAWHKYILYGYRLRSWVILRALPLDIPLKTSVTNVPNLSSRLLLYYYWKSHAGPFLFRLVYQTVNGCLVSDIKVEIVYAAIVARNNWLKKIMITTNTFPSLFNTINKAK